MEQRQKRLAKAISDLQEELLTLRRTKEDLISRLTRTPWAPIVKVEEKDNYAQEEKIEMKIIELRSELRSLRARQGDTPFNEVGRKKLDCTWCDLYKKRGGQTFQCLFCLKPLKPKSCTCSPQINGVDVCSCVDAARRGKEILFNETWLKRRPISPTQYSSDYRKMKALEESSK
eukprot:g4942.t1